MAQEQQQILRVRRHEFGLTQTAFNELKQLGARQRPDEIKAWIERTCRGETPGLVCEACGLTIEEWYKILQLNRQQFGTEDARLGWSASCFGLRPLLKRSRVAMVETVIDRLPPADPELVSSFSAVLIHQQLHAGFSNNGWG